MAARDQYGKQRRVLRRSRRLLGLEKTALKRHKSPRFSLKTRAHGRSPQNFIKNRAVSDEKQAKETV